MAAVRDAATGEIGSAATAAGARRGAELAGDFFDGDKSGGLFAQPATDPAARSALLAAVDTHLPPEDAAAAEGATPDGRLTEDEVGAALRTMPADTSPGLDGLPYDFYTTFWSDVAGPLVAAVNEAFLSPSATPCLDGEFTMGVITLVPTVWA
jgi:hypothetical protein